MIADAILKLGEDFQWERKRLEERKNTEPQSIGKMRK